MTTIVGFRFVIHIEIVPNVTTWVGEVECKGLQLKAVSDLLLAAHFAEADIKLQGLVPIAYLDRPLHV